MWSNYALALYRTLSRHRLYAALNTLGLALGIAVCAVLLLVVRFEAGFDRWTPHAQDIFRVNRTMHQPGRIAEDEPSTQPVLLPNLLADFPQIKAGVRLMGRTVTIRSGATDEYEDVVFADPAVFDVFELPFAAGAPRTALADSNSLVVSQAMARKYFGTEQALGRALTVVVDGRARDYRITGVLKDLPSDSSLSLDLIARLSPEVFSKVVQGQLTDWGSAMLHTFVRLRSPADAAAIQAALPAFVDRRVSHGLIAGPASRVFDFTLVPLTAVHFRDAKTDQAMRPGADPLFVGALGAMGVVTLLIAIVNYISLATARAGMRAREVAVRKVMGATRGALVVQFVAESVAMALGAGLIAAALVELAMPGVRAVLGEPVRLSYFGASGAVAPLLGLCVLVGLAAGVYPAIVLSGFRPASVLASARTPGGGRTGGRVREALAVFQFAVAITLMVCTAVIFTQMQYLRHADIGFRREGLVIVRDFGQPQVAPRMRALVDAFRQVPGAIEVTASDRRPATDSESTTNVKRLSNPAIAPDLTMEEIGPNYASAYGLKLVAGRALGSTLRMDDFALTATAAPELRDQVNLMINRSAARALGFAEPQAAVGEKVQVGVGDDGRPQIGTIVGVVEDVRFRSPRRPSAPQFYVQTSHLGPDDQPSPWNAAIRVRDGDQAAVIQRLAQVWRGVIPGVPFRAETVQAALQPYYDPDARRGQLFAAGAVLSGLIACLGLYGLAAFNTARRFKEIGIRKTLGASTRDVMRLLIGEFLRPVLWANLIAWPVAWLAMRAWLAGFDQRIALNPAYFLAPAIAAVLVAILTVADQAWRVARAEPAVALRYE
ncbi:MAG: ABC transporter permease [Phenylobacterium sp.]|nr:MAG: ABC transporter permease [Phenylobacterium sp.]